MEIPLLVLQQLYTVEPLSDLNGNIIYISSPTCPLESFSSVLGSVQSPAQSVLVVSSQKLHISCCAPLNFAHWLMLRGNLFLQNRGKMSA